MLAWVLQECGVVCNIFLGKYPEAFSIIGLGIVALIFLRLRKINRYIEVMHQEAEELKLLARFPYCDNCSYRETCQKRLDTIEECTYEYRKTMAAS